jgi:hypothetical protein
VADVAVRRGAARAVVADVDRELAPGAAHVGGDTSSPSEEEPHMLTRRALVILAVVTLVLFGISAAVGNHHHGLRQAVGDVSWNGFLLGLVLVVVGSVAVLVRSRARVRGQE